MVTIGVLPLPFTLWPLTLKLLLRPKGARFPRVAAHQRQNLDPFLFKQLPVCLLQLLASFGESQAPQSSSNFG